MSRLAVLFAAFALVGCHDAPGPAPFMPEPTLRPMCGAHEDQYVRIEEVSDQVTRAFADAFARSPEAALAMFADVTPRLRDALTTFDSSTYTLELCDECPQNAYTLGGGVVGAIRLVRHTDPDADRGVTCLLGSPLYEEGWVVHTDAGWRIHATAPERVLADTVVRRTHAEVWLSYERRWLDVDVELEIEHKDDTIVLDAPRFERANLPFTGLSTGFRLVSAAVDGKEDRFKLVIDDDARIAIAAPPGRTRVHLRYQGSPPLGEGTDQAREHELQVHEWLPRAAVPMPNDMEIVVHVPEHEELVASMALAKVSGRGAWTTYRGRAERDTGPILLARSPRRDDVNRDIRAGEASLLPLGIRCEDGAKRMVPVLAAMAAIAPLGAMRLSSMLTFRDLSGQQESDLILLRNTAVDGLCGGGKHPVAEVDLAHELAHRWFGTRVRNRAAAASNWWESLAEYAATSTLEAAGRDARATRSDDYAALPTGEELAMTWPEHSRNYRLLSYGRGMLLLTALEDRVGRARMLDVLRDFIAANDGKLGSWDAVVASVERIAGHEPAAWLRRWLDRPGAPDLRLDGVGVSNRRVRATLVQTALPPFEGAVVLGFAAENGTIMARTSVVFASARTPIDLEVPAGAVALVVDPDHRLPRKYDPKLAAEKDGRQASVRPVVSVVRASR